ncbi:MAG: polysaccharide deacetylase family protein [Nitrospiria bacterium]
MLKTIIDKDLGRDTGKVLLSFDDGPNPQGGVTKGLLDVLRKQGIRAAFCLIGKHAAGSPELVKRYRREGHLLVNHGMGHKFGPVLSNRRLNDEIRQCDAAIAEALEEEGFRARYFRPPYGVYRAGQARAILDSRSFACITFFISDVRTTPLTYKDRIQKIAERLVHCGGGAIVLHERLFLHWPADYFKPAASFNRSWIPEGVDWLLRYLRQKGFGFTDYERGF